MPNAIKIIYSLILTSLLTLDVYGEPIIINIEELISDYSQTNDIEIIVDQLVRGRVSLYGNRDRKISEEEFFGVLMSHGYSAFAADKKIYVIPRNHISKYVVDGPHVIEDKLPSLIFPELDSEPLRSVAIYRHTFKNRPWHEVAVLTRPLIPKWAPTRNDRKSNSMMVAGEVGTLKKMREIFISLDKEPYSPDANFLDQNKTSKRIVRPNVRLSLENTASETVFLSMSDLIETYSRSRDHKTIIVDPRVKGRVIDPRKTDTEISDEEFYSTLLSANFGAYTVSEIIYVEPLREIISSNIPLLEEKELFDRPMSSIATTVFFSKDKSISYYASEVSSLIAEWGDIIVDKNSNSLIASGTVRNLMEIRRILRDVN